VRDISFAEKDLPNLMRPDARGWSATVIGQHNDCAPSIEKADNVVTQSISPVELENDTRSFCAAEPESGR
jgi:hypothetical protein